jgi:cell division protein FtsW
MVMAGAHLLSMRKSRTDDFKSFMLPFGAVGGLMCLLVLAEPDLGTAIIIAGLLLGLLWIGGMKFRHWIVVASVGVAGAAAFTFSSPVRMARVLSFLNPSADPHGSSFQLSQSLVALGRGGWLGVGPGESVQKFSYLPKAHTDMIFAILGEEFGLIGAGLVILLFGIFAVACWRLARRCADPMGRYLLAGCGMLVTLQAVVNIGGVIGALPLTGVPLPFISYGRNSLIVMLLAVGLILSVARSAPALRESSASKRYENVTNIDRRRGDRGARRARPGAG